MASGRKHRGYTGSDPGWGSTPLLAGTGLHSQSAGRARQKHGHHRTAPGSRKAGTGSGEPKGGQFPEEGVTGLQVCADVCRDGLEAGCLDLVTRVLGCQRVLSGRGTGAEGAACTGRRGSCSENRVDANPSFAFTAVQGSVLASTPLTSLQLGTCGPAAPCP